MNGIQETMDTDIGEQVRVTAAEVVVSQGPNKGTRKILRKNVSVIGSGPNCDMVLSDPTVSQHHLEINLEDDEIIVIDLDSKNGTFAGGVRIYRASVNQKLTLTLGKTTISIAPQKSCCQKKTENIRTFGNLQTKDASLTGIFDQLIELAKHDTTIMLEGATGTGKSELAKAIHEASPRHQGPFVTVDCGSLPATLAERELFGNVKGAYTDAKEDRSGLFQQAHGGTLFIDEIGELPLSVQPVLLRAIENREVKRLGSHSNEKVDIRIICATNRSLRKEVNTGNFRSDLYYRTSVAHFNIPSLKKRPADIPMLAKHFLLKTSGRLGIALNEHDADNMLKPIIDKLISYHWPGNGRELAHRMERLLVRGTPANSTSDWSLDLSMAADSLGDLGGICNNFIETGKTFRESKQSIVEKFEIDYVRRLLAACNHNISEAARRCGMDRRNFQKLVRKYKI